MEYLFGDSLFLRDQGIRKLVSVMGLLADDVRKTLDINEMEM